MQIISVNEREYRLFGASVFLSCSVIAALLQVTVGLYYTQHYFLAHFLLGMGLPFLYYAILPGYLGFWIGILATSVFHFGYEFWEDQLARSFYSPDWVQIFSGATGLVAAWFVYRLHAKREQERR